MRALASVLIASLALAGVAQPFGRFGYGPAESHMGFRLDKDGFRAEHVGADRFRYFTPSPTYRVTRATATDQVAGRTIGPMSPDRVRCTLTAPGFEVYVPAGLGLRVGSTAAPYLSWTEGSVGSGVETPKSRWIVVSFRDQQPPLVLGFLDGEASVSVRGTPGDWEIRTNFDYRGWIRVGLPLGVEPRATFDAATLGRLTRQVRAEAKLWTGRAPELLGMTIEDSGPMRTITARFSASGAIIPPYWLLARTAGYPMSIPTPTRVTPILSADGPIAVAERPTVVLQAPNPRLPLGRPVTLGGNLPNSSEPWGAMWGGLELPPPAYEKTLSDLVRNGPLEREPITGQVFGFDRTGRGLALLGQQALWATVARRNGMIPDETAFSALNARFDWWTGGFSGPPAEEASALAHLSVANGLLPGPSRVTVFAEMALAGRRELQAWTKTRPLPAADTPEAPWASLRRAIHQFPGATDPLVHALRSPWRIRVGEAVIRDAPEGVQLVVNGRLDQDGQFVAELGLPEGVKITSAQNTSRFAPRDLGLGWTRITYSRVRPGPAVLSLQMERGPVPIPAWRPSPSGGAANPR